MKLYTLEEAGDLLGVSGRTVQRLIADGELRCVDVAATGNGTRRRLRVRSEDLERFINKRTANTKSA